MTTISRNELAKGLQSTYYLAQWCFNARYVKDIEKVENAFIMASLFGLEHTLIVNLAMLFEVRKDTICFHHYLTLLNKSLSDEQRFMESVVRILEEKENKTKISKLLSLRSSDVAHRNAKITADVIRGEIPNFPRPTLIEMAELLGIAERIISGIEVQEFGGHTKKQREELGKKTMKDWGCLLKKLNS